MDQEERMPEETEETASEEMGADEIAADEPEEPKGTGGWVIAGLGGLAVLLVVAIVAVLAGALSKDEPAPTKPSGGADAFITIVQPGQGAVLSVPESISIRGQAGGLFENSLVVQALDAEGNVLAQEPTTIDASEPGGVGTWSIDIRIPDGSGMKGAIRAFSTSPQDGSVDAEATVSIQYGEGAPPEATKEPTAEPPPDTSAGIEDLLWSLSSLGGNELVPDSVITMALTSGEVNGSAGCNNYFGGYALSGNMISFGDMGTTLKSCPEPPRLMDQENQYLTELQNAEAYAIDSKGLQMFGSAAPITLFYNSVVMGTLGFMQPVEIPSGSTLTVQLQDTSLADAPAKVLGETVIADFSVLPVPFSVSYDPTVIDTRNTYRISARITDEAGNLIFINTSADNVITRGNPSVIQVIVEPV